MTPLFGPGVTQKRCRKLNCTTPGSGTHVPPRFGGRYRSDCAWSGAVAASASRANETRFMRDLPVGTTLHLDSARRTPHSALDLPPLANPLVVQHRNDAALLEHLDSRRVAVCLPIEGVRHARIDDQLGAHHAGGGAHEDDLVAYAARGLHERVHLRMNAPTASRPYACTPRTAGCGPRAVRQPRRAAR